MKEVYFDEVSPLEHKSVHAEPAHVIARVTFFKKVVVLSRLGVNDPHYRHHLEDPSIGRDKADKKATLFVFPAFRHGDFKLAAPVFLLEAESYGVHSSILRV